MFMFLQGAELRVGTYKFRKLCNLFMNFTVIVEVVVKAAVTCPY